MAVTVQYVAAAPFIRHLLVHAVSRSQHASTQRDTKKALAEADGMAQALRIMKLSDDQTQVAGIADEESLPADALVAARARYGDDLVLGR